jgi:hypothetical protein
LPVAVVEPLFTPDLRFLLRELIFKHALRMLVPGTKPLIGVIVIGKCIKG